MRIKSLLRFVVAGFGLLFTGLGLRFWLAPDQAGDTFNLAALGVPGLVSLQADLGGLFVSLGVIALAAAFTRRQSLATAGAIVLGAIASGRVIGAITSGAANAHLGSLALEVAAAVALALYARRSGDSLVTPAGSRRRLAVAGIALGLVAAATAAVLNPTVEQWLFNRGAADNMTRSNAALLDEDALRVAVCGSSAPLPSASRAKACAAVFAGGKFYLVDVGPESVENLVTWGVPLAQIGGVLLTHFHSDHIGDLGEANLQTWANGRQQPLNVYGGPGVDRVVGGFNDAYRADQTYRTAHHTARWMSPEAWPLVPQTVEMDGEETGARDRTAIVLEENGVRITAIEVNHDPVVPAYAYRFDYKGRSVVVSGDLKYHPPLAMAAKDADLLVIEAISRSMVKALQTAATNVSRERQAMIMHDIQDYHISPTEAGELANMAGVKLLVFYHLLPTPDNFIARRLFAHDLRAIRPRDWTIADDGSLYTLPAGSRDIRIGRVAQ
ncbi:MAG TPA: MBL fold metallo-hydrolase [Vicinamibacterales bacterium]|nr:MBL fold metallo-hydrolase [Vicinamibacterales bacterium]